jgi:hypothetical protein
MACSSARNTLANLGGSNDAGGTETRRFQTSILSFCNVAPIWFSKRQPEASTSGLELTGMKKALEMIEALRWKLRVFGIPIDGLQWARVADACMLSHLGF